MPELDHGDDQRFFRLLAVHAHLQKRQRVDGREKQRGRERAGERRIHTAQPLLARILWQRAQMASLRRAREGMPTWESRSGHTMVTWQVRL